MLYQLSYASKPAAGITVENVAEIVAVSSKRNAERGITGFLAYRSDWFLQALEGGQAQISSLLCLIGKDPRHTDLVILGFHPIDQRQFRSWSMGYAAVHAGDKDVVLRYASGNELSPTELSAAGSIALLRELSERTRTP